MAVVYFIRGIGNWVYVGSTDNLKSRLIKHNSGGVKSTKSHRPFKVIYTEDYKTIHEARTRERQIKKNRSTKQDILKNLMAPSSSLV